MKILKEMKVGKKGEENAESQSVGKYISCDNTPELREKTGMGKRW